MSAVFLLSLLAVAPLTKSTPAPTPVVDPAAPLPAAKAAPDDTAFAAPHNKSTAFAQPGQSNTNSIDLGMARIGLLLLVVGGLGLGYWYYQRRRRPFAGSALIHKIAHSQVAPGQGVALVEVDGRMLVLGTGQGGLRLLYHYAVDNSDDLSEPDLSDSVNCDEATALRQHLSNLGQREQAQSHLG